MATLPYRTIPDAPEVYHAGNMAARMLDGLGFRYYWATEGLSNEALAYRPSADGRTTFETLQHIADLSEGILHVAEGKEIEGPFDMSGLDIAQLREKTLLNIETASQILATLGNDMAQADMLLSTPKGKVRFPFWNVVNGPISDALYHTGQIVSFRRSAGNPMQAGVNPFLGRVKADQHPSQL